MNKDIKPIIILDAFFHNENCLNTFNRFLSSIKTLEIPIMLVTNSKFDVKLLDEINYIFYDEQNKLFKNEYPDTDVVFIWYGDQQKYFSIQNKALQKHGLSVLSNLYHSTNLAKSLGFTHFFRIEYDSVIKNINPINQIIKETSLNNKRGYIYVNENRFLCFQIWYFELDYFTSIFPYLNNEEDYIEIKQSFGSERGSFMIAEEFLYNLIKNSLDSLIVKNAPELFVEFPESNWNTIISPAESDFIVDGFVSSVHKVAYATDGVERQFSPIDNTKFSIVTWNCSSGKQNKSTIKIIRKNTEHQIINHEIFGDSGHLLDIFDLDDEDIVVEISMNNHSPKSYIVNKNNIQYFTNILTINK